MTFKRNASLAVVLLAVGLVGCGGGTTPNPPTIRCFSAELSPGQIGLQCGPSVGSIASLRLELIAQVPVDDLAEVYFDIEYDDSLFGYVDGSARVGSLWSDAPATPLYSAAPASGTPGRLIVAVATQAVEGIVVKSGKSVVLELEFERLSRENVEATLTIGNAGIIDSNGRSIGGVEFIDGLMLTSI